METERYSKPRECKEKQKQITELFALNPSFYYNKSEVIYQEIFSVS